MLPVNNEMKLDTLKISNFHSFGKEPTEILLKDI